MTRFQDIFIKRKLRATIAVVRTVGLLLVSGGFVGSELITCPQTMAHHLAARAEIIGDRSLVACSADRAVLKANDSACGINTSNTPAATTAIPPGENEWEAITCVDNS